MRQRSVNLSFGFAREDICGCAAWSSFHLVPSRTRGRRCHVPRLIGGGWRPLPQMGPEPATAYLRSSTTAKDTPLPMPL